ncbi:hypothetical protein NKI51_25020 [Mesorhizobium australicum]|nr:hypothetical protein X738_18815 [Mesorhizobium sp. LNHC209A00]
MVYSKASCHDCEKITSAFEGRVISQAYGDTRAILGLKRGNGRKWPNEFNLTVTRDAEETTIPVKEDGLPVAIWLTCLNHRPLILDNKPVSGNTKVDLALWSPLKDYQDRLANLGPGSVPAAKSYQFDQFFRFINRIAFAYAHALLKGKFSPLTSEYVLRDRGKWIRRYIGADIIGRPDDAAYDIHELYVAQVEAGGLIYIAVRVHLFALNNFPAYVVIVGTANAETEQPTSPVYDQKTPGKWLEENSVLMRSHPRVRFRFRKDR